MNLLTSACGYAKLGAKVIDTNTVGLTFGPGLRLTVGSWLAWISSCCQQNCVACVLTSVQILLSASTC